MKRAPHPRFDVAALREHVGETVFARGEDYFEDGQVEILAVESARVLARVAGTQDYRTEITGQGRTIGGSCSCRAFADRGFCKHMVAVALAANAAKPDAEGGGALARIREHLRQQKAEALVDLIVDLAERDPVLLRKLDLASAMTGADDKTVEARLRKAIDAATRTTGAYGYRGAGDWADEIHAALDPLATLATGPRAALALKLAERAIDQIESALEEIDDSDGEGGAVLARARDIHVAAAAAARPNPVALARDLFERETTDEYGLFDGAATLYAKALGKAGLTEFRRLAEAAWEKLPARSGRARESEPGVGGYDRLRDILDVFAERDGDLDTRVALRTKDLSSAWSYLQLIEFCRDHGRRDEALRRAEEALWLFEDDGLNEPLVMLAAELMSDAGRRADAEAQLWRVFERRPTMQLYERLRQLDGQRARDRAVTLLEGRIAADARTGWQHPADILLELLMHETMLDEAWAMARKHGASPQMKHALAEASETTHPDEALAAYAERVDRLAVLGGNGNYAEAAKLIARMAEMRGEAEQRDYVAALKARHRSKRNFMKLLS